MLLSVSLATSTTWCTWRRSTTRNLLCQPIPINLLIAFCRRNLRIARETDEPRPTDDYGRVKLAAEAEIADALPLSNFTILRPVLVYGAAMEGNLAALLKLAKLPIPLPLNNLAGRRSLLDRAALVRAIIHSLRGASTDGRTFIVSDRTPVTVPQIVAAVRRGLGRKPNLFSCPPWLLTPVAKIAGQADR